MLGVAPEGPPPPLEPKGDGSGYRALSPCHEDRERSLSIGFDDRGRPIYWCFACKDPIKLRAALISELRIDSGCLPMSGAARKEIADRIADIVLSDLGHAAKVLAVGVLVISGGEMPEGESLERLAARVGVSRREAYRARHALPKR